MRDVRVTERAAITIKELREGRHNDYNEYDIRMEQNAIATAGLSEVLEDLKLVGDELKLSSRIIGAIHVIGMYTTLLHDLVETRDESDNEYRLHVIGED